MGKINEGSLHENDLRRAFVAGCKFWEYYSTGCTMWQSDLELAETEANDRYSKHGPLADLANIGKDAHNHRIHSDRQGRLAGKTT